MSWTWTMQNAAGTDLPAPAEYASELIFHSQSDAETWVGEVWADLLELGIDGVTLFNGDAKVYGPMSLHPANES